MALKLLYAGNLVAGHVDVEFGDEAVLDLSLLPVIVGEDIGESLSLYCIAGAPDNSIYIGFGCALKPSVARFTSDGAFDTGFDAGILHPASASAVVISLTPAAAGGVYVCMGGLDGGFEPLVKLGLDGEPDPGWSVPAILGSAREVRCCVEFLDERVAFAGRFTTVDGNARTRGAYLLPTGAIDTVRMFTAPEFQQVLALDPSRSNYLYVAGAASFGAETAVDLLDADGSPDVLWTSAAPRAARAIAADPDGNLWILCQDTSLLRQYASADGAELLNTATPETVGANASMALIDGKVYVYGDSTPPLAAWDIGLGEWQAGALAEAYGVGTFKLGMADISGGGTDCFWTDLTENIVEACDGPAPEPEAELFIENGFVDLDFGDPFSSLVGFVYETNFDLYATEADVTYTMTWEPGDNRYRWEDATGWPDVGILHNGTIFQGANSWPVTFQFGET